MSAEQQAQEPIASFCGVMRQSYGYACAVIVGHDEYWTWQMHDRIDAFVDRGGGLAHLAGNFQWQVRSSDELTRQFCYRVPAQDPGATATMGLTGLGGTYSRYGVAAPHASGGFTIYRPDH